MAHLRDNPFNPSSPHSSTGGGDSFKGTPETRLTAFSPDESSAKSSKLLSSFTRSTSVTPLVKLPINSHRGAPSDLDKDPFVSSANGTTLSPTASTFKPVENLLEYPSPHDGRLVAGVLSTDLGLSHQLSISSSTPLSIADVDDYLLVYLSPSSPYSYICRSKAHLTNASLEFVCEGSSASRNQTNRGRRL